MSGIQTGLELNDQFSGVLYSIINSMNIAISTMDAMQTSASANIDTSSLQAMRDEVTQASIALDGLQDKMQNNTQQTEPLQVPTEWKSPNVDVFTGTGIERFQQEVQSANALMEQLNNTQNEIAKQAYNTELLDNTAVSDLNNLSARISILQNKLSQIQNNPVNFGTAEANSQLEQLRGQIQTALTSQENLNNAISNMDVSSANSAYIQLSQNVANTERCIRDNTDEQGRFNSAVQDGVGDTNNLISAVGNLATAYIGVQTAKKAVTTSDDIVQMTSRLNMMNDGLQSTQDLLNMTYLTAQDARGSMAGMGDVIARFGNNAKDAFGSSVEVINFANLVQKSMTIAGASTQEASNAMLQLSQGLGSGVLRGDELNSVFEQSPNLIQYIADYLDVGIGKIREMAQDGELTADVVKAAIFSASDDINSKFADMPMTWGQAWQSMENTAIMAFQPVLQRLNDMVNSDNFQTFSSAVINDMAAVANVILNIFEMIGAVGGFVQDNWSLIEPLVVGAAIALSLYTGALIAYNTVRGISNMMEAIATARATVHSAALMMESGATFAATAAQYGFNAALMACPITWILLIIIAVISAIYFVVAAINKARNTSVSATGVICGTVTTAAAVIWNTAIGLINAVIQSIYNTFVQPFISIIEWVLNVCNGGFDSFGGAVANLIGQIISWFLSLGKVVTKIIDAIFGTDWTSGLNSLQDTVLAWGKTEDAITLDRNAPEIDARINYGDAWDAGYSFGEKVDETVQSFNPVSLFGKTNIPQASDYADALNTSNMAGDTAAIKSNTDKISISAENLKYLRDIADRDVINRFTTAEIKVDMTNNNNISSEMDLDGAVEHLKNRLEEEMNAVAEGVY